VNSGHVARQQVRGELDAVKTALQSVCKGFDGPGLGQARGTFHQQVAVRQQGDDESLNQMGLADDLPAEPLFQGPNICACHAFSCCCR
jgi:hypothetical protein